MIRVTPNAPHFLPCGEDFVSGRSLPPFLNVTRGCSDPSDWHMGKTTPGRLGGAAPVSILGLARPQSVSSVSWLTPLHMGPVPCPL